MSAPNLFDVLSMLATGGGVGAVLAFLFEQSGWFQVQNPQVKRWLVFGLSLALPLVAWFGILGMGYEPLPGNWQGWVESIYQKGATGFLVWAGSQGFHLYEKAVRK